MDQNKEDIDCGQFRRCPLDHLGVWTTTLDGNGRKQLCWTVFLLTRMQKPKVSLQQLELTCKQSTEHSLCNRLDKIRTKLHRVNHETAANPSRELQRRMERKRQDTDHVGDVSQHPTLSPQDVLCSTDITLSKKIFFKVV